MGEVNTAFVQDQEHRPKFSTMQAEDIPVIDLSPITNHTVSDPSSIEWLTKEIGSACQEWGLFQVTNHGVPLTLRQNIQKASTMFFAQNLEKRKVSKDESSPTGYYDTEHTKNVRDWKEVFDFLAKDPTFVPLTSDEHDDRAKSKADQGWIRVKPTSDAYIVNVGDIIQFTKSPKTLTERPKLQLQEYSNHVWSNDACESVEHRVVVNSKTERFSTPFFFFAAHDTEVKPLEELINEQNPSKYGEPSILSL